MKQLTLGILAHVDSGKTTLSEGLLYQSGNIRKFGRVDHKDAFLDTHDLERSRGITIFAKQAVLTLGDTVLHLLDTPGHVDFSAEMERTLQVLDYAILVISGSDGVQSHTETLWALLDRYRIPTFLFVNKMDQVGADQSAVLAQLQQRLSANIVDFSATDTRDEALAICSDRLAEHYFAHDRVDDTLIAPAVFTREVYPCFFGSALKMQGISSLLQALDQYTLAPDYPDAFGAKAYKISFDEQGNRLTHLKITGGSLQVKTMLEGGDKDTPWREKINQIRLYSGVKSTAVDQVHAGAVCCVTGLTKSVVGEGYGFELSAKTPMLEPVLTYQVLLPDGMDPHIALQHLEILQQEDPQLHVMWQPQLKQIHLRLMGAIQLEILQSVIADRFGFDVSFAQGQILYKETIAEAVIGKGHYEPLRHYAEVHLLMQPLPCGSGLQFATACSQDELDKNWQNLVLTHLGEKTHTGVLTNAPITDLKITLVAGRAHYKHTEGGDFRQATYRALRHGLMSANSVLLEPIYQFRLEIPIESVGRALTDLGQMGGEFDPPELGEELAVIVGTVPVCASINYQSDVLRYSKGRGKWQCSLNGYDRCHNTDEVVRALGYHPASDVENSADSVFCANGAGVLIPWQEAERHMHLSSKLPSEQKQKAQARFYPQATQDRGLSFESDDELLSIFEQTYGKIDRNLQTEQKQNKRSVEPVGKVKAVPKGPLYLLVDGYNIVFTWDDLAALAKVDLGAARTKLMDVMSKYASVRQCELIVVFDAYKVKGYTGEVEDYHNIKIVYTKEAETADMYIEKVTHKISKERRVCVATSDGLQQRIILGHGATRMSARMLQEEVQQADVEMRQLIDQYQSPKA